MKRSARCVLLGFGLGEAAVAAFLLVMTLLALNAALQEGGSGPVTDTLALWPSLAVIAALPGVLLGLVAARVQRRRREILLAAALGAYVLAAFVAVLWSAHTRNWHVHGFTDAIEMALLGLWAGAAYSLFAVPGVVGAALLLERWTRRAE